jgi:hypothetical protein
VQESVYAHSEIAGTRTESFKRSENDELEAEGI